MRTRRLHEEPQQLLDEGGVERRLGRLQLARLRRVRTGRVTCPRYPFPHLRHVLVASAADAEQHDVVALSSGRAARSIHATACAVSSAGMIPSSGSSSAKPAQRLVVGDRDVRRAPGVLEVRVLGPDARDSRVPPRSSAPGCT